MKRGKEMKFFRPTSELKELLLLQHIEKKPDTTQKEIAKTIGGVPSLVNVYIDNLEKQNYMKRDYKSAKVVYYNITSEGIKRKNYLAIIYFHELLELYRMAEENMENFIQGLVKRGYKDVLFYGAGEVAETILRVIKSKSPRSLKVVALIDDSGKKQGGSLLGYKIISTNEIRKYHHDGIVITSYTFEEEIMHRLKEVGYPEDKIERYFSE